MDAIRKLQWNDWWKFRDNTINDTGYFWGQVLGLILGPTYWAAGSLHRSRDAQVLGSADGDHHSRWGGGAVRSVFRLELAVPATNDGLGAAARYTRDGRYRWVAHRIFNYLPPSMMCSARATNARPVQTSGNGVGLLVADDTIRPVPPTRPAGHIQGEAPRPRINKAAKYLTDLDPDPLKAHIDCSGLCTIG